MFFFFIYDGDELVIHGYSDTSFQLDIEDINSHSIYFITLNSCVRYEIHHVCDVMYKTKFMLYFKHNE